MPRILLVDEHPHTLLGTTPAPSLLGPAWDLVVVPTPRDAQAYLATTPCAVLIADPAHLEGVQLLCQAKVAFPDMVRIGLAHKEEPNALLHSAVEVHQAIPKPCDPTIFWNTIARASSLQQTLTAPALRSLVSGIKTVPSLPALYLAIIEELKKDDPSIRTVAEIIAQDIGMTTKILQVANSAYFARSKRIANVFQAVALLGLDMIQALVLTFQVFTQFPPITREGFSLDTLWHHSLSVGNLAGWMAKQLGLDHTGIDNAMTAGLVHDVGTLVFFANMPAQASAAFAKAQHDKIPHDQAETAVLGATHAEIGAYLLGLWGLHWDMVEAVAFHHAPLNSQSTQRTPLTAVHLANVMEQGIRDGDAYENCHGFDWRYLRALDLEAQVAAWYETCREMGFAISA